MAALPTSLYLMLKEMWKSVTAPCLMSAFSAFLQGVPGSFAWGTGAMMTNAVEARSADRVWDVFGFLVSSGFSHGFYLDISHEASLEGDPLNSVGLGCRSAEL